MLDVEMTLSTDRLSIELCMGQANQALDLLPRGEGKLYCEALYKSLRRLVSMNSRWQVIELISDSVCELPDFSHGKIW